MVREDSLFNCCAVVINLAAFRQGIMIPHIGLSSNTDPKGSNIDGIRQGLEIEGIES